MNTTDHELEERLRKLPREQPSAALDARMSQLFAAADAKRGEVIATLAPRSLWPRLVASGLAMAACLGLAVIVAINAGSPGGNGGNGGTGGTPGNGETKDRAAHNIVANPGNHLAANTNPVGETLDFKPVRIEQVWSQIQPGDVITLDDNTPLRRFRRQTVEHLQLIDDKQNIRIEYTRPRNDMIVVPVKYD